MCKASIGYIWLHNRSCLQLEGADVGSREGFAPSVIVCQNLKYIIMVSEVLKNPPNFLHLNWVTKRYYLVLASKLLPLHARAAFNPFTRTGT